jgi:hypothetical protein
MFIEFITELKRAAVYKLNSLYIVEDELTLNNEKEKLLINNIKDLNLDTENNKDNLLINNIKDLILDEENKLLIKNIEELKFDDLFKNKEENKNIEMEKLKIEKMNILKEYNKNYK